MKSLRSDLLSAILICLALLCGTACSVSGSSMSDTDDEENMLRHSEMLRMYQRDGYICAEVLSPGKSGDNPSVSRRYILVNRDSVVPDGLPEGTLLRTPLRRLTVFSTIYTDLLAELGAADAVSGVVDAQYISTPAIKEGLENGTVTDCGSPSAPSVESILASESDGILFCTYEGMEISGLDRLAVPQLVLADNYETSPLGRAEWMIFIGALVGKQAQATAAFRNVEKRYQAVIAAADSAAAHPKVMTDNLYQGVWYVPGGRSYQARLIGDAGGQYVFADNEDSGSLALSLEEMLDGCREADVWLMRVMTPLETRQELLGMDSRYDTFRPYRLGDVYVSDAATVDIFSMTAFHPDLVLEEYSRIFRLASGQQTADSLRYYHRLK